MEKKIVTRENTQVLQREFQGLSEKTQASGQQNTIFKSAEVKKKCQIPFAIH